MKVETESLKKEIDKLSNDYEIDGFDFKIIVVCDGLSAETEEFELKLEKKKKVEKVEKKYATQEDWDKAAKELKINNSDFIRAIAQQESENIAFLATGNPKILYERHHFYNFYLKKHGKEKADLLSEMNENIVKNKNGGYGSEKFIKENGGFDNEGFYNYQFERLEKAIKIDEAMAIKSTSFGLFQILGEYCGYSKKTEKQFFEEIVKSEKFQIQAFVNFIKGDPAKKSLPNALNNKNWRLVASIYNGKKWETYNPDYAKNIEKYYNKKPWLKK